MPSAILMPERVSVELVVCPFIPPDPCLLNNFQLEWLRLEN